jgi:hypothetical protein
MRLPTPPRCAQLVGASHLSIIATSPELRHRRPWPPPSICSSSHSDLSPLLAQPHSTASHSSEQLQPWNRVVVSSASTTSTQVCSMTPESASLTLCLCPHHQGFYVEPPRITFTWTAHADLPLYLLLLPREPHRCADSTRTASQPPRSPDRSPRHRSHKPELSRGEASRVSFQFHFRPKSLSCATVML